MSTATRSLPVSTNSHEFSEKLVELRSLLADIAKSAPAAAGQTFDELKAKASELSESCQTTASNAAKTVIKTVRENPAKVTIAAVGAGLLVWWLLSRNSKSE